MTYNLKEGECSMTKDDTDKLLDELLKGRKPGEIFGGEGLLRDLTKRLVERTLEGEMTDHSCCDRHFPDGRNSGNSRNGKTSKIDPIPND